MLLIGIWIFWVARGQDPLEALRGEARAHAFLVRLQERDTATAENKGHLVNGRWEGRNGSSITVEGDKFDLQVPVPWPGSAVTPRATPDKIVAFLNSPTARAQRLIAPEPWHAEWHAGTVPDAAAIVFRFRAPADAWRFLTLYIAAGELDSIATYQWADRRTMVTTLVDEGYLPPSAVPPHDSRDAMQLRLLWLAVQTERLAAACEAEQVKTPDGRTASQAFRDVAARARVLRGVVRGSGPIPNADLEQLGNDAWRLASENRWDRPDGCRVMNSAEDGRLNTLGYDIKTNAVSVK